MVRFGARGQATVEAQTGRAEGMAEREVGEALARIAREERAAGWWLSTKRLPRPVCLPAML